MRTVLIMFAGTLGYGLAVVAGERIGLSPAVVSVSFVVLGVILQIYHARSINRRFASAGLLAPTRDKQSADRTIAPLHVQLQGMLARALLFAGIVMPLLSWLGWIRIERGVLQ